MKNRPEHPVTNPSDLIIDYWSGATMYNEQNQSAGENVVDMFEVRDRYTQALIAKRLAERKAKGLPTQFSPQATAEAIAIAAKPQDQSRDVIHLDDYRR